MAGKVQPFNTRQHMLAQGFEIFRYCDSHLESVALHHHDFFEVYLFLNGNHRCTTNLNEVLVESLAVAVGDAFLYLKLSHSLYFRLICANIVKKCIRCYF